jgi:hypothetical protein
MIMDMRSLSRRAAFKTYDTRGMLIIGLQPSAGL